MTKPSFAGVGQTLRTSLLAGAAALAAPAAFAQDGAGSDVPAADEIIVTGEIIYRNRTNDVTPVLSYDLEYFQRFEPLTAGDALKRVPSVSFLSDVIEADGARLRGLDPGYTQILINGERVPGAGFDRSFFVDRIPAELIERVEIVRSSSANRSGDAVAGALNIVLRDGYSLDGGYLRAGALMFDDKRVRETYGAVWGGQVGPGRALLGFNVQGRRNPKEKTSWRYDQPGGTLENIELQSDIRNGEDYSLNAAYDVDVFGGELKLNGFFVRTDRLEDEDSIEYRSGLVNAANLLTLNDNDLDIQTDNLSLGARFEREMFGGETVFKLGYATIKDERFEFENEAEYLRDANPFPEEDRFTADQGFLDIEDKELTAKIAHKRDLGGAEVEFGLDWQKKDRDTDVRESPRVRFTVPNAPAPRPTQPPFGPAVPVPGGLSTIEEVRIDPYVQFSGESGAIKWEAGLRYETTDVEIVDQTAAPADRNISTDFAELLPSASVRFQLNDTDRLYVSAARTVRRPNFNFLTPVTLEAELSDNDLQGNPRIEPEKALGFDIGVERRLGRQGIVGLNVFYRDIQDLIEVANTGVEGSEGPGTFVFTPRNTGDGKVYGVEFDLSTPLTAIGLKDTGVFLNYSWLDSEITDQFGERRFNDQSESVFNVGFIQDLPIWGAAFGASYRKQGEAYGRVVGEEVTTTYGAELEVFVEKRLGENVVIRFTGSNLLNSKKEEVFDKFDTVQDQVDRDYAEYELESEEAGPVFQLIARVAF